MDKTDAAIWKVLHGIMISLQKTIIHALPDGMDYVGRIYKTPEEMRDEFLCRAEMSMQPKDATSEAPLENKEKELSGFLRNLPPQDPSMPLAEMPQGNE